jgi:molybdate transport system ATP-binding protein
VAEAAGRQLEVSLAQTAPIPLAVELACREGELQALVGPSGSGKTTILRNVAGLERPRQGRITCAGQVWLDTGRGIAVRPQDRRIGLVFQSYALFPHMTARSNIAAALGHLPRRERGARAGHLLALVNLDGLENRYPHQLSGGQQQRVALARALAREPKVLLLDEPFSAVDRATRERLYQELATLRARLAMPILLVTHDLAEATALADRITVLHHGRTLQSDPPQDLILRPRSAEVARLIGHRNVFEGELGEFGPGRPCLDWGPHRLELGRPPAGTRKGRVRWVVPASHIVLHRRERPSRGQRENPVPGVLRSCIVLGDTTNCELLVDGMSDVTLSFSVPTHVARRNGLGPGARAAVSLLADGIHLMPEGQAPAAGAG